MCTTEQNLQWQRLRINSSVDGETCWRLTYWRHSLEPESELMGACSNITNVMVHRSRHPEGCRLVVWLLDPIYWNHCCWPLSLSTQVPDEPIVPFTSTKSSKYEWDIAVRRIWCDNAPTAAAKTSTYSSVRKQWPNVSNATFSESVTLWVPWMT